jgi:hypothetical protein
VTAVFAFIERQRKLTVTTLCALGLAAGLALVAWRPAALEGYRVYAEWSVYLAGFFGGANALSYWTQRAGGKPPAPEAK